MTKVAVTEDLTREEIVDRYRRRIAEGQRTKLTRVEREQLALLLVETLIHLSEAGEDSKEVIQALCEEEIELLEEGYPQQSINSHYLPMYTRLIREAIESGQLKLTDLNSYEKTWTKQDGSDEDTEWKHYALDFLVYDRQTQQRLRNVTTANNNQRQDHRQPVDVEAYLDKAQALLHSDVAEEVAIALCALTGRRHTEIVSRGTFEATEFPYLIRFDGQLKDPTPPFDILTLIPARDLLPHLKRLKAMVSHLDGLPSQAADIRAFNTRVNHRVRKAFEATGIVPVLKGFKTVSIHRLRGVYGAIAIHFFCPPTRHEHRFLQHYLGHLVEDESQERPNASATQHYFHYVPMRRGILTPAMGVKLSAHGPAPLPETDDIPTPPPAPVTPSDTTAEAEAEAAEVSTARPQDNALAEVIRQHMDTIAHQAQSLNALTAEVQALRQHLEHLETEHHQAIAQTQSLAALQQQWTELKHENHQLRYAHLQLEAIKALLKDEQSNGPAAAVPKSTEPGDRPSPQATPATDETDETASHKAITPNPSSPEPPAPSAGRFPLNPTKDSKAQHRAAKIVAAIQTWNDTYPHRSFAITKGLLEHEFGINRKAASEFLNGNRNTLHLYYHHIGVANERGHNRQPGRDIQQLKPFIQNLLIPSNNS